MIKYYQENVLKISYFIFESNNSADRKVWVKDIKQQLSDLEMLESETIMLSSILDLDRYRDDLTGINLWPKIKLGAVGLLLGTVKTFELALKKDLDYLLVFEDDFIIGDNFYNKLTTVMQEKEDFDLIALGYHINPEQAQDPNIPKDLIVPIEISKPWLAKTYSYVVSKKAMEKFLSYYYSNEVFPVDTMFFDKLPKLKIYDSYCINPHLIFLGDVNNVDSYGYTILKLSSISKTQTIESVRFKK